jgi:uncharacterized protein
MNRVRATLAVLVLLTTTLAFTAQPRPNETIAQVPLRSVRLLEGFWQQRLEINRTVTIPHIMRQNDATGRVANFARAARRATGPYEGRRFNDTDVYKAIEAASYSLIAHPDPVLERQLDDLIAAIAAAQEPDGYLYPARTIDPKNPAPGAGPARWVHENGSHELYNAGHLYEAAVAHFQATGKRTLLDVAVKNATLVRSVFGPDLRHAVPGHQEIELALVRLSEATGTRAYLDLAAFFLDQRGHSHETEPYPDGPFAMYNGREYKQDHRPVVEQDRAVGHAVRATYMYAGMADIAARLDRPAYRGALERLYNDVIGKRLYITGGIGARSGTESFGDDYELPSRQAYTETCAAIGLEQWATRMFRLTGDAQYLDLAELVLYNGALSGVSASGDRFFYQNPLASDGKVERSAYFEVACCPANLARTLAQLPGLLYASSESTMYVLFYASSEARLTMGGVPFRLTARTPYPWDGDIELRVEPDKTTTATLALRVPGWSRGALVNSDLYRMVDTNLPAPTAIVNGQAVRMGFDRGFARITREWRSGDVVHIYFPMPVQRIVAHPAVADANGRVALQRGPLIYAFEGADNGPTLDALRLPPDAEIRAAVRHDLLGGVRVLTGTGIEGEPPQARPFVAIPYFAWANRGAGELRVWIRQ